MTQHFFSGSSQTKLDEKGRFVLPQQMRYGLVENGRLEFTIGLGIGGCLAIYRQSDIEKIVEKFQAKAHVVKYQKFFTLFFSTLHHTTCDKLGRVLVPQILKKAVGLKGDIVVAGVMNKIEIWPSEKYELDLQAFLNGGEGNLQKLTEEAFSLLDESASVEEELSEILAEE
ncbi:MAG: hypothetical protein MRY21_07375 [Simkaniaceae bacterium]|nr:hypothetical protein [Simkaniaceae bacterium]